MPSVIVGAGPHDWSLTTDEQGYRDYTVIWQVRTSGPSYGPNHALWCPGLPLPGASLNIGSTVDAWVFYQGKGSAKLKSRDQHHSIYLVEQLFTNRPVDRCNTSQMNDPLLELPKWRGGFDTFQREATVDNAGDALLNSAGDRFRGPAVQIEDGWPTIEIEQNVAWINLPFLAQYRYSVNNATWWGMPARTVKCKTFTWERINQTCSYYFKVVTSFQLNEDKWDLHLLDEGFKVLGAGGAVQAKDNHEENVHVLLDGAGNALAAGAAEVYLDKRVLKEKNFSVVGWPATPI